MDNNNEMIILILIISKTYNKYAPNNIENANIKLNCLLVEYDKLKDEEINKYIDEVYAILIINWIKFINHIFPS